jgi:hypothetical protein
VSGTNNGDGNVLIGTSTDDATNKLQVNGAVKSTQFNLSALKYSSGFSFRYRNTRRSKNYK